MNPQQSSQKADSLAVFSFVRFGDQLMLSPFIHQMLRDKKAFRIFTNRQGMQIFGDSQLRSYCTYLPSFVRSAATLGSSVFSPINLFNHKADDFPKLAHWIPRSRFLEDLVPTPTAYDHRHRLFAGLAVEPAEPCWIYHPEKEELKQAEIEIQGLKNFAVLVVGSHPSKPLRNWPIPVLANILRELTVQQGIQVVLLGGSDLSEIAGEIILQSKVASDKVLNLCGRFSFRQSAAIMDQSRLVIAPDTGLMHLGIALSKPVLTFTHPRYDITKLLPPVVRKLVMSVCLRQEDQFANCEWERWKFWMNEFLPLADSSQGKKIEGVL